MKNQNKKKDSKLLKSDYKKFSKYIVEYFLQRIDFAHNNLKDDDLREGYLRSIDEFWDAANNYLDRLKSMADLEILDAYLKCIGGNIEEDTKDAKILPQSYHNHDTIINKNKKEQIK